MALASALPQGGAPHGMCAPAAAQPLKLGAGQRIDAIDVLRGLVIVIMALDHIRDYLHASGYAVNPLNPEQTNPILYATRWITHVCAPTFVLLSGVSAFLQGARGKSKAELAWRLFTRGLWLVALEVTIISFGWAWSVPYTFFLQVIWAIGVSMIVLSACVWLPVRAVLAIGAAVILGHNLFDGVQPQSLGPFATLWSFAHSATILPSPDSPAVLGFYPVLPWFGVMAFGYGLGQVFVSAERDRILMILGGAMILAFLVLRGFNIYGNPIPWTPQADLGATLMVFFDVNKYPPSLQYVCATLGPVLLLFPLLARLKGPAASLLRTYGAVPLMAYVAHVYVVHAVALASRAATGQDTSGMFNTIHNAIFAPDRMAGISFPLWYVYLAWIAVLAIIYPLCRWWTQVKRTRRDWWLSYM
jgi:uncharacterized membrane protein